MRLKANDFRGFTADEMRVLSVVADTEGRSWKSKVRLFWSGERVCFGITVPERDILMGLRRIGASGLASL